MNEQYFETKLKDKFLPKIVIENIENGKLKAFNTWNLNVLIIDKKYLRKIKIQNIEKKISEDDKLLLEFLLNDNYVNMLSNSEAEKLNKSSGSGTSWTSGMSGMSGMSGVSGPCGMTGTYGT